EGGPAGDATEPAGLPDWPTRSVPRALLSRRSRRGAGEAGDDWYGRLSTVPSEVAGQCAFGPGRSAARSACCHLGERADFLGEVKDLVGEVEQLLVLVVLLARQLKQPLILAVLLLHGSPLLVGQQLALGFRAVLANHH